MPVGVYNENASRGSSGDGAKRSSRSIATSAPIAKMIRPALASGDSTIDAEDIPAIAKQINPTRPAGTPAAGVRRSDVLGGRMTKALTANMPATVAVATNALRQLPKRANVPPTSGPSKTDMLQLADINAIVRDQTASGKVARTAT
jgi:hypothetical protein